MLEASNVNSVEELISTMELQRQFEVSIKLISLAEDIDRAGAEVMRLPEG
jgi:flagellar basal-body rod protein FlgF